MEPPSDLQALGPLPVGRLLLENNLVAAPMAGISNLPFRLIAREAGAAPSSPGRPAPRSPSPRP
jgi:hypothetical protein